MHFSYRHVAQLYKEIGPAKQLQPNKEVFKSCNLGLNLVFFALINNF